MISERDIFHIAGPVHLTSIYWSCGDYQRSVAASLVQGVYVLERDRQQNRKGTKALAPDWWEFFGFELIQTLIDDVDSSIFAAIYEFKPRASIPKSCSSPTAPKFVIAFRGTITKPDCMVRDMDLDFRIIRNGLHKTSRFEIAMQAVGKMISTVGNSSIWLTGHSLGSALAILAGKNMAKTGTLLETFLFNPPFVSAPIERIKDEKVRKVVRTGGRMFKAGLALAFKGCEDSFDNLSSWVPNLFVNRTDLICSEYIGYFEHRERMEELGVGSIDRLATKTSIRGVVSSAFRRDVQPLHLLPSANLTINSNPKPGPHGIRQWWRADLQLQSKQYCYSPTED